MGHQTGSQTSGRRHPDAIGFEIEFRAVYVCLGKVNDDKLPDDHVESR